MLQGGPEGLRSLTNPKAIIVDRWPSVIQTSIPKVLDYPLHSLRSSWLVSLFFYGLSFLFRDLRLSNQGILGWPRAFLIRRWMAHKNRWHFHGDKGNSPVDSKVFLRLFCFFFYDIAIPSSTLLVLLTSWDKFAINIYLFIPLNCFSSE